MNASNVLLVFPSPFEAQKAFSLFLGRRSLPKLGDEGSFVLADKSFAMLVCGYASTLAALRVEKAVEKYNPKTVVLCGFCGACSPDFTDAEAIADSDSETFMQAAMKIGARKGKICCCAHVASNAEKETFARDFGAAGVDMESAFVKDFSKGRAFASFRLVSDSFPAKNFPHEFFDALINRHTGGSQIFAPMLVLLKNPRRISGLVGFVKKMRRMKVSYDEIVEKLVFELSKSEI